MGNCKSLNCTAPASDELLDADGDIVGLGVLAAFFITALTTAIAIFWGYFYDALPESYLHKSDEQIIKKYKKSWIPTKFLPWLQRKWNAVKHPICSLFMKEQATITHHALSREKRTEALTKFILSLSDQQLVTGLAILIGALSNRCKVSVYEFRVVVSLAWFSSTTHLATLGVLQNYFVENQVVRNFRVLGMLSLMVLLLFSWIAQDFENIQTVPLQCAFENSVESDAVSNFTSSSTYSDSTVIDVEASNDFSNPLSALTSLFLIFSVLSSYYSRVSALYNEKTHVVSTTRALAQRLTCMRLKLRYPGFSATVGEEDFEASWQYLRQESFDETYKKYTIAVKRMEADSSFRSVLRKNRTIISLANLDYTDSFMSEIPQLGFDMAFGISQVILSRNYYAPSLGPSSYSMDFGQIVPLFLLSLPILVAVEMCYESRRVFPNETLHASSSETLSGSQAEENTISFQPDNNGRQLRQYIGPLDSDAQETRSTSSPAAIHHLLDVNQSRPDPDGADLQIINGVFSIFIFQLIISILCGCLYNIPGPSSFAGAIIYIIINVATLSSAISRNYKGVKIETLHAQIIARRARGLGNGTHLVSNSQNAVSNSPNGTMAPPASTSLEVASSAVQDPVPTCRHSRETESIQLQIFTPAPASTNSPAISRAVPKGSTSTAATISVPSASVSTAPIQSTSAQPGIMEKHNTLPQPQSSIYNYYNISSSTLSTPSNPRPHESPFPAAPSISPTDDGRIYLLPPHRHDTEADIGVVPVTSPSFRSNNDSNSREMYPEPEDTQCGATSSMDSGDANTSSEEGVRRRGTVENPGSSFLPDNRS